MRAQVVDAFDSEMSFWVLTLFPVMVLVLALIIPRVIGKKPRGYIKPR